jgi:hypothetical protein
LELPRSIIRHATCCAKTFTGVINTIIGLAHHVDLGVESCLHPLAFDPIVMILTKINLRQRRCSGLRWLQSIDSARG